MGSHKRVCMTETLSALFYIPVDPTYHLSLFVSSDHYHIITGSAFDTNRKIIWWEETSCKNNTFQKLSFLLTWFVAFSKRKRKTKKKASGFLAVHVFSISFVCIVYSCSDRSPSNPLQTCYEGSRHFGTHEEIITTARIPSKGYVLVTNV